MTFLRIYIKKRAYFSREKLVLINLNAIFPFKICCNFSYKNLFLNVGIMDASGLLSFVYSINFQIRQIPARNHHLSCEESLLLCGSRFLKKASFFPVWDLVATGKQIEKNLFFHLKNTSKLWRKRSLALLVYNFLIHLHFFKVGEIMLLKYGNLILPAEHTLDLHCARLSKANPSSPSFVKIIQSFISMHNT